MEVSCSISFREKFCGTDMSEVAQVHVLQKSMVPETIQPTAMKSHTHFFVDSMFGKVVNGVWSNNDLVI
jgi:hypothetical protein